MDEEKKKQYQDYVKEVTPTHSLPLLMCKAVAQIRYGHRAVARVLGGRRDLRDRTVYPELLQRPTRHGQADGGKLVLPDLNPAVGDPDRV